MSYHAGKSLIAERRWRWSFMPVGDKETLARKLPPFYHVGTVRQWLCEVRLCAEATMAVAVDATGDDGTNRIRRGSIATWRLERSRWRGGRYA